MNHRRAIAVMLISGALAVSACGSISDDGSPKGEPAAAGRLDPVSAWQVYYDVTHPDLDEVGEPAGAGDPVSAWQVYYDVTHPDLDRVGEPAGAGDPVSAWQVYYDVTHPATRSFPTR